MMRSTVLALCCILAPVSVFSLKHVQSYTVSKPKDVKANQQRQGARNRSAAHPVKVKRSRFEKFVDKIFDKADTNKDGTVDSTETYEMVLRMYIKLNQRAPIPPPSRQTVDNIFRAFDVNRNKRISREEFTNLAETLVGRGMTRLVALKMATLFGAPLLAEYVVRKMRGKDWLQKVVVQVVPERFHSAVVSVSFWRSALTVLFVATLGNIVLGIVNFLLDLNFRRREKVKKASHKR